MNTKPIIVRTDAELNMGASRMSELVRIADVRTTDDDQPETLRRSAAEADYFYTCYAPLTAEVIDAAPRLRGIVKYGVGTDSIDLEAASRRAIPVVHCPDYGTASVAEQAFALMIAVARKICHVDRDLRRASWLWPQDNYIGTELHGKTLGLIGYGRIGQAMARLATGFAMHTLASDPYVERNTDACASVEFAALDEVVLAADFLSLHCVLTPETRGIINAERLAMMKRHAILVNVSRGALVDQDALAEALARRTLAGAGLDVFVQEPLPNDSPFLTLDNVVLSPHFAFYTREAYERLEAECLQAFQDLIDGRVPKNMKNKDDCQVGMVVAAETTSAEALRMEGDVNRSAHRSTWESSHLDETTRQVLQADARYYLHQSLSTPCLNALQGCHDSTLVDLQGRELLDFHGNSAHQVGYAHPRVVEAIKRQLDELSFCPRRYTNRPAVDLGRRLASIAPAGLNKVLLVPSGTGAVGVALKLARYATGRHMTISMWDSFHGASLDAISVGGESLFREGLEPLLPGCHHVPWPRSAADADAIAELLQRHRIGAVIAEPMRCTTMEYPPREYWQRVRELCTRHGALLILDEIPLALGRTGKMFCCEHFDVEPDMLVIGKGLGGGIMPLAAVIVRDQLDVAPDRALGHYTHEKSPVAAAAALATLEVIEHEGLVQRSADLGRETLSRLVKMQQRQPLIREARGLGLALAVELGRDGFKAVEQAERVMYDCMSRGLSFKVSDGNVLTLTPPLVITDEQMDSAINTVEWAIARNSAG